MVYTIKNIIRSMSKYIPLQQAGGPLVFRQLFESQSSTYTYILADSETREAIIIDPVLETVQRDKTIVESLNLKLKNILNTHVHADHITGSGELKKIFPGSKSHIAECYKAKADVQLNDNSKIQFGKYCLIAKSTPGHTLGCLTYIFEEAGVAFTGDALLIRGCGRTDFQNGNASDLYDSVHKNILSLPQEFLLYPAHDYTGQTMTSVEEEKKFNPRLTKSKDEFLKIMDNLNLPKPAQIDKAVPANMKCGIFEVIGDGILK